MAESQKSEPKKTSTMRQSNIELLRIFAMIIIIAHHFAMQPAFANYYPVESMSANRLWMQFIEIGGKIGVDIFVLISGYFLVSAQSFKTGKAIRLWGQLFFYSVLFYTVFVAAGVRSFDVNELCEHLTPVMSSQWWFASTYFVLYLLSPFLNVMLRSFDKKQYVRFLLLLFVCWCVIPTFTLRSPESNNLLWFIFLYALAGYFRLYNVTVKHSGILMIAAAGAAALLTFMVSVLLEILGTVSTLLCRYAATFYDMQRLPILVISVLLFIGFLKLDMRYSRFINVVSSATFGVYLIHDNEYVRSFLWETVFRSVSFADSGWLIPYSVFAVAVVFVGCTVVELLRIHTVEKWCMPLFSRLAEWFDKKTEKLIAHKT